jgi:HAD superfamily hydrolase (TIGR01509 family)
MPSPSDCLVIFDCDGVLVDSERLAVAIDVKAIGALGWPITEAEVISRHLGRSNADVLADIEARLGRPVPADWEGVWDAEYRRAFDEQLEAVPGVAEAIKAVAAEGFQTSVASSGSQEKMRRTLGKTGLWNFFDGRVFSASEVELGKPEPDLFLYVAQQLGFSPDRCVVVEDSQYGVAGAKAAGMQAIGFAGGVTPSARLAAADAVITEMADLPGEVTRLLVGSLLRGAASS